MTAIYNATRIAVIDGLIAGVAAGATNGKFQLLDNSSPPVVVADFALADPPFGAAADTGGIIQATLTVPSPPITSTYNGSQTTIAGYRLYDGDGNLLLEDFTAAAVGVEGQGTFDVYVAGITAETGYTYELQGLRLRMARNTIE